MNVQDTTQDHLQRAVQHLAALRAGTMHGDREVSGLRHALRDAQATWRNIGTDLEEVSQLLRDSRKRQAEVYFDALRQGKADLQIDDVEQGIRQLLREAGVTLEAIKESEWSLTVCLRAAHKRMAAACLTELRTGKTDAPKATHEALFKHLRRSRTKFEDFKTTEQEVMSLVLACFVRLAARNLEYLRYPLYEFPVDARSAVYANLSLGGAHPKHIRSSREEIERLTERHCLRLAKRCLGELREQTPNRANARVYRMLSHLEIARTKPSDIGATDQELHTWKYGP